MSAATNDPAMGHGPSYQGYLAKYVLYFIRCPTRGRPKDCIHQCPRYLHSGPCEPCRQFVELECYCEATGIVKPCKEWCEMEDEQKQLVKCCRGRCAKILECDHQCPRICHRGRCADPKECVENVVRYCNCERIERVFPCRGCGAKDQEVACDAICAQLLDSYRRAIAEMKNNPVRLANEAQTELVEEGVEVSELEDALCSAGRSVSSADAKQESETESGFNEEKTDAENRADIEDEPGAVAGPEGRPEAAETLAEVENLPAEVPSGRESTEIEAETLQDGVRERRDSCDSSQENEEPPKKCLQRVSRSSSRVSNISEEDLPRKLDQEKIVKIMRSSTRRKKLIKCEDNIINELQTS